MYAILESALLVDESMLSGGNESPKSMFSLAAWSAGKFGDDFNSAIPSSIVDGN